MPTGVRDWATVDYYGVLGVLPGASSDDIGRAFRLAAKQLHPDTTDDPVAIGRFKEVSAAYSVLSDDARRRDYDHVRASVATATPVVQPRPAPRPARRKVAKPWSRGKATAALVSGILLTILGIAALSFTWIWHEHDARQAARYIPVTAQRIGNGEIGFETRDSQSITTKEPRRHGDPNGSGLTVKVRYDPADPQHVIVDTSTIARDVTFAIVALKLLAGGVVFTVLGARRRRAATTVR